MSCRNTSIWLVAFACSASWLVADERPARRAQRKSNAAIPADKVFVYKTVGDVALKMYVFYPKGLQAGAERPAVVFFFGGGWKNGSPRQFLHQCRYLASRGMVAMAADYRVHSRHKARVADCVADAKSAIRWVRQNAKKLGVDPDRIASGGGSAGGHLGAAVGALSGFDEKGEDASISSRPNAMLLFNPALNVTRAAFGERLDEKRYAELSGRFGADAKAISPTLNVDEHTPPTIVFHGKNDTTVPFAQAEEFAKAMKSQGRRCVVAGYAGEGHGFFNYGRGGNKAFRGTMLQADRFLQSLGWLKGDATIDRYPSSR